jgi:hypothetical protein
MAIYRNVTDTYFNIKNRFIGKLDIGNDFLNNPAIGEQKDYENRFF